jgi:ubiquinone/menaquinone biosynthesis C-methylase UbiE
MSPPSHDSLQNQNTYFINIEEQPAETTRLMFQDRLLSKAMGGMLPEHPDPSAIRTILDIACGPGGWLLDVAFNYPHCNMTGIDINPQMIEYANAQAQSQQLSNASFIQMNVLEPLNFSENSFDVVNMRLLTGFMSKRMWPKLLQECLRITCPGGMIYTTEWDEPGTTNSAAYEQLNRRAFQALQRAGHTFSPDGRHYGITAMLGSLLYEAGYRDIQRHAHVIDFSARTEGHESWFQNITVGFQLVKPFMLKQQVITLEEFDDLYQQMLIDMYSEHFCGVVFLLTVWGKKPEDV